MYLTFGNELVKLTYIMIHTWTTYQAKVFRTGAKTKLRCIIVYLVVYASAYDASSPT